LFSDNDNDNDAAANDVDDEVGGVLLRCGCLGSEDLGGDANDGDGDADGDTDGDADGDADGENNKDNGDDKDRWCCCDKFFFGGESNVL